MGPRSGECEGGSEEVMPAVEVEVGAAAGKALRRELLALNRLLEGGTISSDEGTIRRQLLHTRLAARPTIFSCAGGPKQYTESSMSQLREQYFADVSSGLLSGPLPPRRIASPPLTSGEPPLSASSEKSGEAALGGSGLRVAQYNIDSLRWGTPDVMAGLLIGMDADVIILQECVPFLLHFPSIGTAHPRSCLRTCTLQS
jgi:hypothetical protein